MLGCRQTVNHVASDLMHSVCIEGLARISLDLPLGGWLCGYLAIIIRLITTVIPVVADFLLGDINDARTGVTVSNLSKNKE